MHNMRKNRILNDMISLLIAISGMLLISACASSMTSTERENAKALYNDWVNYERAVINAAS